MAYNKAKAEKKWKQWKDREEKLLRESGINETVIQELRRQDWEMFNADRRFLERWAPFPEYKDLLAPEAKEPEVDGVPSLLQAVDNEQLLHILLEADRNTLQILLLKMMGFSVYEISEKLDMPEQTIYTRIGRLKKKIKNFSESE